MADVTITAANVTVGAATTRLVTGTAAQYGAGVGQGQSVYKSTTDSKWYPADADAELTAAAGGIALVPGVTDAYGVIATQGLVNMGATLAVGQVYVVSTTAGGVAPYADLGTGDFVTILGVATTTALLDVQIVVSNTAKA